jgi:hypothetical protein
MLGFPNLKSPVFGRSHRFLLLAVVAITCLASAQTSNTSGIEAYAAAMKQSSIADRITAMEHFLAMADSGALKADALEVLAWDYRQMSNPSKSTSAAEALLKLDQENAIALAILSEDQRKTALASRNVGEEQFSMATRGLAGLGHLRKPEGMLPANFNVMQRQITGMLNGVAGLGYLDHDDFDNARIHLKDAVNAEPNNARYIYGLALSLLLNKQPDAADGYWYLARAVNLTQGTPSGEQVSQYARERYRHEGGSDAEWNKFLMATATPRSTQPIAVQAGNSSTSENPSGTSSGTSASAASGAGAKGSTSNAQVASASKPSTTTTAKSNPPNDIPISASRARNDHPELNPPPDQRASAASAPERKKTGLSAPNAPISLGILLQTSLLSNDNRREIIAALSEMVQRLRPEDEAFIMAFSNQLDFEQDLTANEKLLEDAIAELKPKSGTALLEGVEFAAGHLKRIGKNPNRVLLIISDGRNSSNMAGSTLSAQLRDVRVDCIGIDVGGEADKALLQRLAAYSGGHASFAASPQQFRAATTQMSENLGIEHR